MGVFQDGYPEKIIQSNQSKRIELYNNMKFDDFELEKQNNIIPIKKNCLNIQELINKGVNFE